MGKAHINFASCSTLIPAINNSAHIAVSDPYESDVQF